MATKYKWDSAGEWLEAKLTETTDADELRSFARSLASKLDNDSIQDLFQTEMARDGFFAEVCVDCDGAGCNNCESEDN
jgi:hypothetical protein